jgi:hypothetical protein
MMKVKVSRYITLQVATVFGTLLMKLTELCSSVVNKLWVTSPPPPQAGAVGPLGGMRVDCMRNIFILNEIWAQGKIYILIGTLHC